MSLNRDGITHEFTYVTILARGDRLSVQLIDSKWYSSFARTLAVAFAPEIRLEGTAGDRRNSLSVAIYKYPSHPNLDRNLLFPIGIPERNLLAESGPVGFRSVQIALHVPQPGVSI